jgi:hypothetical protein
MQGGECSLHVLLRSSWHSKAAQEHIVLTGYAIAPANTKDQPYVEDFLAARRERTSAGDGLRYGFEGRELHQRWANAYGAIVLAPPCNDRKLAWPGAWRRWHARMRQIVEVVHGSGPRCFVWMKNVRILLLAFKRGLQRWWHCITPVSGSIAHSVAPHWRLPI